MSLSTAIFPPDLVSTALKATDPSGWFGGATIKKERLFVVISAQVDSEKVYSEELSRLASHRAFHLGSGEWNDELFRWFRVAKGFGNKISDWQHMERETFESATGYHLAKEDEYVCLIEPTDDAPKIHVIHAWTLGSYTYLGSIDVRLLQPASHTRMPKTIAEELAPKRVAIVGVGSGGGTIALQLASVGVGNLLLFDNDKLEQHNYVRHELTRRDLGRTKVNGLKSDIEDRELLTQVTPRFLNVLASADDFREILDEQKPDLVICATDSRRSRRFVNHCAMQQHVPLVIAGILDNGRIGEVLLADPGRTACYECVRRELRDALDQHTSDERPDTPYVDADDDECTTSTTCRFDVEFVASLATRLALQVLAPQTFQPVPASYVVWGREATTYPWPFEFKFPLSLNYVSIVRQADCPVCGARADELIGINIDERCAAILAKADEISD